MGKNGHSLEPMPDRYSLGFSDNWREVTEALVDLENSGNLDEISLRILRMVMDGYSFREIGTAMGMSHNTAIKKLRTALGGVNG